MKKYTIYNNSSFCGDSHRYETDKGIISLVHPCDMTFMSYEIFCIEGNLFDDIERYETLEMAEERILNLISDKFKFGR